MTKVSRPLLELDESLVDLEAEVWSMGDLAKTMLLDGFVALRGSDSAAAENVRQQSATLASYDESLESRLLTVLSAGHASPDQIRRVGAMLKVLTYFNRVGRYGHDIARAVAQLKDDQDPELFAPLSPIVGHVEDMLDVVLDSIRTRKAPDLDTILKLEDDVDAGTTEFMESALVAMERTPGQVRPFTQAILVARALERCADNLCKAVEKLHAAATGERIILR